MTEETKLKMSEDGKYAEGQIEVAENTYLNVKIRSNKIRIWIEDWHNPDYNSYDPNNSNPDINLKKEILAVRKYDITGYPEKTGTIIYQDDDFEDPNDTYIFKLEEEATLKSISIYTPEGMYTYIQGVKICLTDFITKGEPK